MELMILSGLLAVFGASAVWATRPAPLARERLTTPDPGGEAGR